LICVVVDDLAAMKKLLLSGFKYGFSSTQISLLIALDQFTGEWSLWDFDSGPSIAATPVRNQPV
jgi:hypothetical protein